MKIRKYARPFQYAANKEIEACMFLPLVLESSSLFDSLLSQ
jgi:hypothetical protein